VFGFVFSFFIHLSHKQYFQVSLFLEEVIFQGDACELICLKVTKTSTVIYTIPMQIKLDSKQSIRAIVVLWARVTGWPFKYGGDSHKVEDIAASHATVS